MNLFRFLNNYTINKGDLEWNFNQVDEQIKQILLNLKLKGIFEGWKVSADGSWNVEIGEGYGHDENGNRLETKETKILNCEFDYEGISVIPPNGFNRFISIFAVWSQKDGDTTGLLDDMTPFKKHILDNITLVCVRGEQFAATIPATPNDELSGPMPNYSGVAIRLGTFVIRNGTLLPTPTGILSTWKMEREDSQDGLIDFKGEKLNLLKSDIVGAIYNIANLVDSLAVDLHKEMDLGEYASGMSSYKIMDLKVSGIDIWSLWYLDSSLSGSVLGDFRGGIALLRNISVIHNTGTNEDDFQLLNNSQVGKALIYSFEGSLGLYSKAPVIGSFKYNDFEGYNIIQESVIDQSLMTPDDSSAVGLIKGSGKYVSTTGTSIKKERIYNNLSAFKPTGPVVIAYLFFPFTIKRSTLPVSGDITINTDASSGLDGVTPHFVHSINEYGVTIAFRSISGVGVDANMMWRGSIDIG